MKYVTVSFNSIDKLDVSAYKAGEKSFDGYNVYTYQADDEDIVENATYAIVQSALTHQLTIARILLVADVNHTDYNGKFKEVLGTASTDKYIKRKQRLRRLEEIEKRLKKRAEEVIRERQYRDVLANDAEAQALIAEFDELKKE